MKKTKKVLVLMLTFIALCAICLPIMVNADTWTVDNFDGFNDYYGKGGKLQTATENIMGSAIKIIRIVGTGISIIMLTYVAIKYMSAAPSEKAEFKKSATAFVVGAIVLFAATNILTVIAEFATGNIVTAV